MEDELSKFIGQPKETFLLPSDFLFSEFDCIMKVNYMQGFGIADFFANR